jgi:hypothetical protein
MTKSDRVPRARRNQLVVKELADETLIYDETNHQAHCLNQTAAFVWSNCDGRKTISKLARLLKEEMGAAVPEETVLLALRQLHDSRLLDTSVSRPTWAPQTSRRALIRTMGIAAAVTLPLITSVHAAAAAAAASCRTGGQSCSPPNSNPGNCCQGFNCNGQGICQAS